MTRCATRKSELDLDKIGTSERWQHGHDGQQLGSRWFAIRVSTVVADLRDKGAIGDAEAQAAERWYSDYVLGELGVRDTHEPRNNVPMRRADEMPLLSARPLTDNRRGQIYGDA